MTPACTRGACRQGRMDCPTPGECTGFGYTWAQCGWIALGSVVAAALIAAVAAWLGYAWGRYF